MTTNTPANHEAKSRAAAQVAAWKDDIQSFFDTDWNRLRTLMMDLEEETWSDDSSGDIRCIHGNQRNAIQSPGTTDSSDNIIDQDQTSAEQRPVVKDRLTALAEQIEQRLRDAQTDGR